MEELINSLLKAYVCGRVEGCKCDLSDNKLAIKDNKIVLYCKKCGWGEP